MNSLQVSGWLPSILVPFFTLSYPTAPPAEPDSFHDSRYYTTGVLDACVIVSCVAVMVVLRDIARIYLMEPFAEWKLTRDWERSQRAKIKVPKGSFDGSLVPSASDKNGGDATLAMSKGESRAIRRSVVRFAEQGWSFICYTINFSLGIVSNIVNGVKASTRLTCFRPSTCIATFPRDCCILRTCG